MRPGLPGTAAAARDLAGRWLAHRPRDARGLVVPWINRWGPERPSRTRIAYDRYVEQTAFFHDDHGSVPDFTRQNMARQREAMVCGLCQVCGRATPWSRRNLVVSAVTTAPIDVAGHRGVMAVTEPWLDDRCAAIATLLCPALIRRRHDEDLRVLAVRSPRAVQLVVSQGKLDRVELARHADGPAERRQAKVLATRSSSGQVAMWVKAVLLAGHR